MAKQEKETKAKSERTPEQIEAEKAAKAAKKAEHAAAARAERNKSGDGGRSRAKDAAPAEAIKFPDGYVPRLYKRYQDEIAPQLATELKLRNRLEIPRVTKVVINMGLGKAIAEKPRLEAAVKELTAIAGQKAVICQARKSVSNFKLRQGMEIGVKVTLRGQRMWEFLDRLIYLAIPRVKDFRGLNPKAFDGRGNYNLGLTEQSVFPEVHGDQVTFHQGLNITIVTTSEDNAGAFALLQHLGMPFAREQAAEKDGARKAG